MSDWTVVAGSTVLVSGVFVTLVRRMLAPSPSRLTEGNWDPDWFRTFSAARYRPMQRLLSNEDVVFLRRQPGFRPEIEARLKSERRKIFRLYLKSIRKDFYRIWRGLQLIALYSAQDRPDLTAELVRVRLQFYRSLASVEAGLVLHRFGMGSVDASGLVRSMEFFETQLRQFLPVQPELA